MVLIIDVFNNSHTKPKYKKTDSIFIQTVVLFKHFVQFWCTFARLRNILRKGGCGGVRGYVSVSLTSMRRILSTNLFRHIDIFDTSPPPHASSTVGRLSAFTLNFYRKSTSDRTNMDLSDMRKKYKCDEEVSCIQRTVSYLFQDVIYSDLKPNPLPDLCNCEVMMIVQSEM